jgi:hypothetical protein
MKAKSLTDFPEFVRIQTAVEKIKSERVEVSRRADEIAWDLSQPKQAQVDGEQAWAQVLEGKDSYRYGVDTRSELRDEQIKLQDRLEFLDQVLCTGEMELDRVVGRCSLEICQGIRKEWVAHVGRILQSLKAIAETNRTLDDLRNDLEREGVKTGSLAHCTYDLGGEWSSGFGGRLVGFQRYIADNYPELADAAGQSVKLKIKALNERERRFEQRLEEEGAGQ